MHLINVNSRVVYIDMHLIIGIWCFIHNNFYSNLRFLQDNVQQQKSRFNIPYSN